MDEFLDADDICSAIINARGRILVQVQKPMQVDSGEIGKWHGGKSHPQIDHAAGDRGGARNDIAVRQPCISDGIGPIRSHAGGDKC